MKLCILIVEDEILIAWHLEEVVSAAGHTVCGVAATPAEAIALAEAEGPDLALMDIHLSRGTSGLEAAAALRERFDVPCIFLSANLDESVKKAARPHRPLGFIGKPFRTEAVLSAISKAADQLGGP